MRSVVFVAPYPLETTLRFAAGVYALPDVQLLGVFQQAPRGPAADRFAHVAIVDNVFDPAQVVEGVRSLERRHGPTHRLLGILEDLQESLAVARTELGLPGLELATVRRFRDKGVMKDALRAAGLPCARHALVHSEADAWRFVETVGFPIVMKPPAGAGCRATYKIGSPQELHQGLKEMRPGAQRQVLAEEFLTGAEYSFETLTLNGEVKFHSISRYYPSPLEAMQKDWIQWVVMLPRDISGPEFDDVRTIGLQAVKALGLGTSLTHMEWFRRPDGSLAIGEIAARPPGAQIVTLMGQAHDRDMYRAWAELMVNDRVDGPWDRQWATGVAFLRGQGQGRVTAVEGLAEAQRKMGSLVVQAKLPTVGMPRASGYEGEGWVIVRHRDTEVVKQALLELITTVKVRYG